MDDAPEVAAFVNSKSNLDLYYTPAAYEKKYRKTASGIDVPQRIAENVLTLKSFYIDVDVKQYDGDGVAMKTAIRRFLKDSGLPTVSVVVATGGGMHLYWVLEEPVGRHQWSPVANALADLALSLDLRLDPAVTRDAARILRIPGSTNHKYDHKPRCEVVVGNGPDTTFDDFRAALGDVEVTSEVTLSAPSNVISMFGGKSGNDDLADGVEIGVKSYAARMIPSCPVMADSLERGGKGDEYHLWKDILHTLAFCEDGAEYIHRVSDKHEKYDPRDTQSRFEESVRVRDSNSVGPVTCKTFSGLSDKCKTCPHFGSIKTPLVLGRVGNKSEGNVTYVREGATFVMKRVKDENVEVKVANVEMDKFDVGHDWQTGRYLTFEAKTGITPMPVRVPMSMVADNRSLMSHMLSHGVSMGKPMVDAFGGALVSWMERLQKRRDMVAEHPFGWDDHGGFSLVGWRYTKSNPPERAGVCDPGTTAAFAPRGDLSEWKKVANYVLQDARPEVHAMVAVAFASPLIKWTEVQAFAFAAVSRGSGHGKTTVMRLSQSVWGDPVKSVYSLNDTINAITGRMSQTRFMPTMWDEIRGNEELSNFVKVLFRANMGKERQRMNARAEIKQAAEINTLILAASNASIAEAAMAETAPSPAGIYRMMQMQMPTVGASGLDNSTIQKLNPLLRGNFGVAGYEYIQKLLQDDVGAKNTVTAFTDKISNTFNSIPEERFWVQSCACLLAGAHIAKHSGIANIDVTKVWACVKELYGRHREYVTSAEGEFSRSVPNLINAHAAHIVVIDRRMSQGQPAPVVLSAPPLKTAKVFVYVAENTVFIPNGTLRQYAESSGFGLADIYEALHTMGAAKAQQVPGAGTPFAAARSHGWEVRADAALGRDFLSKWVHRP